jgi:hypothetical protein
MLRCASSFVIAAYITVRLIPQDSRALPAAFLRGRQKNDAKQNLRKVCCQQIQSFKATDRTVSLNTK